MLWCTHTNSAKSDAATTVHLQVRITQSLQSFVFASLHTPGQRAIPTASSYSALQPNPLPLSLLGGSLCRGMADFFNGASSSLTVLTACSELGIGRCMTTCLCTVTNQNTNRATAAAVFGTRQPRVSVCVGELFKLL